MWYDGARVESDRNNSQWLTPNSRQRLLNISDEVLHILDTYRETDEVGSNTRLAQLLVRELAVGMAGRMQHTRACISHVGHDADEFQTIHEADSLLA